jgi:hypothetical protein
MCQPGNFKYKGERGSDKNQLSYSPYFPSVEPEGGTSILLSPIKSPFVEHSTHPKNPMSIFYFLGTT